MMNLMENVSVSMVVGSTVLPVGLLEPVSSLLMQREKSLSETRENTRVGVKRDPRISIK